MAFCKVCGCNISGQAGDTCEQCNAEASKPREHNPEERVVDLLREGRTIEAIKRYRATRNTDLKTAKYAVESLARQHGILLRKNRLGCVVVMALIILGLGAYIASLLLRQ